MRSRQQKFADHPLQVIALGELNEMESAQTPAALRAQPMRRSSAALSRTCAQITAKHECASRGSGSTVSPPPLPGRHASKCGSPKRHSGHEDGALQ